MGESFRMLQVCAVDFTAAYLLRNLLIGCRAEGWDVEFACADGPGVRALQELGFRHRSVAMSRGAAPHRHLGAIASLAASLRRDPVDLVHTHTPAGGLVGRAAAALTRIPSIVHTFHGLPFEGRPRTASERGLLIAERGLARATSAFFSQAAGDAARAIDLGIARADDLTVIGNGVDLSRFPPDQRARDEVRAELGAGRNDVVVLTISRLVREKGLLELADAAVALRGESTLRYWITGSVLPSDRTGVVDGLRGHEAARLLGGRWQLLGHRDDVPRLLAGADIFALPSYREGLPRSVIEAMASGVPAVTSDIPACRELVVPDETGLLVPVRDAAALAAAIGRLAGDRATRERFGARARELARSRHNEHEVVERQLRVLRTFAQ